MMVKGFLNVGFFFLQETADCSGLLVTKAIGVVVCGGDED